MPAQFSWSAESISGTKKPDNDDAIIVFSAGSSGSTILPPTGEFRLDSEDIVFAVSDGMGGGNAGYLASKLILENISNLIPRTFKMAAQGFNPDYLEQLLYQLEKTHAAINSHAETNENFKGMAATLTLAWFTPENLYLAHIGDSRLYLHRDGKTTQLSEDHSFAWKKLKRGELSEYQYRAHPRRSALYEIIGAGHKNIRPMLAAIPYRSGDQFMLCSDGVIDGLWEKHIHSAFLKNLPPKELKETLVQRAIDNAGSDDTSLITIAIK